MPVHLTANPIAQTLPRYPGKDSEPFERVQAGLTRPSRANSRLSTVVILATLLGSGAASRRLTSNTTLTETLTEVDAELAPTTTTVDNLDYANGDANSLLGNISGWEATLSYSQSHPIPDGHAQTTQIQDAADLSVEEADDDVSVEFSELETALLENLNTLYTQSLSDETTVFNYYEAALTQLDELCETEDCDTSSIKAFREHLLLYKNQTLEGIRYIQNMTAPDGPLASNITETLQTSSTAATTTMAGSLYNVSDLSESILTTTLSTYATAVQALSTSELTNATRPLNHTAANRPSDTRTFSGVQSAISSSSSIAQSNAQDMVNSTSIALTDAELDAATMARKVDKTSKKATETNLSKDWMIEGPTYIALQVFGYLVATYATIQTLHRVYPTLKNKAANVTSMIREYGTTTLGRTALDALRNTYDLSDFALVQGPQKHIPGTEGREYYKTTMLLNGLNKVLIELSENRGALKQVIRDIERSSQEQSAEGGLHRRHIARADGGATIHGDNGTARNTNRSSVLETTLVAALAASTAQSLTVTSNQDYCSFSPSDIQSLLSFGLERAATKQDLLMSSVSDTLGLLESAIDTTDGFVSDIAAKKSAVSRGQTRAESITTTQQGLLSSTLDTQEKATKESLSGIISPFDVQVEFNTELGQVYIENAVTEAQTLAESAGTSWVYPVQQILEDGGSITSSNGATYTAISKGAMQVLLSEEESAVQDFASSTESHTEVTYDSIQFQGQSQLSSTGTLPTAISKGFDSAISGLNATFPYSSESGVSDAFSRFDTRMAAIPESDTLRDAAEDVTNTVSAAVDYYCDAIQAQNNAASESAEKIKFYREKIHTKQQNREGAKWSAGQLLGSLLIEEFISDHAILQPLKNNRENITTLINTINDMALENALLCIQKGLVFIESLRTHAQLSDIPVEDFENGSWERNTYGELTGKERLAAALNNDDFNPTATDGFLVFKDAINGHVISFLKPYDAGIKTFKLLEKKPITWEDTASRTARPIGVCAHSIGTVLQEGGHRVVHTAKRCWDAIPPLPRPARDQQERTVQVELADIFNHA